jgi:hypothetical protein
MTVRAATVAAIALAMAVGFSWAAGADQPKHTIKEVMKKAHKDGLLKKVADGQGTRQDAAELLDLYKSLGGNMPPKGNGDGWKAKTGTLVQAAQAVVDGKSGADAVLKRAANCAVCHKDHKAS